MYTPCSIPSACYVLIMVGCCCAFFIFIFFLFDCLLGWLYLLVLLSAVSLSGCYFKISVVVSSMFLQYIFFWLAVRSHVFRISIRNFEQTSLFQMEEKKYNNKRMRHRIVRSRNQI